MLSNMFSWEGLFFILKMCPMFVLKFFFFLSENDTSYLAYIILTCLNLKVGNTR